MAIADGFNIHAQSLIPFYLFFLDFMAYLLLFLGHIALYGFPQDFNKTVDDLTCFIFRVSH